MKQVESSGIYKCIYILKFVFSMTILTARIGCSSFLSAIYFTINYGNSALHQNEIYLNSIDFEETLFIWKSLQTKGQGV